jgi:hypothetical protein
VAGEVVNDGAVEPYGSPGPCPAKQRPGHRPGPVGGGGKTRCARWGGEVMPSTKHEWRNTDQHQQHGDPEPTEGGGESSGHEEAHPDDGDHELDRKQKKSEVEDPTLLPAGVPAATAACTGSSTLPPAQHQGAYRDNKAHSHRAPRPCTSSGVPTGPARSPPGSRARAGLPHRLRFHDLRATCASLLIAQDASVKAVQAQLGHASASSTRPILAWGEVRSIQFRSGRRARSALGTEVRVAGSI